MQHCLTAALFTCKYVCLLDGIVIKSLLSEICKVYVALQTCMLPGTSYMQMFISSRLAFITALNHEVHFASCCHDADTEWESQLLDVYGVSSLAHPCAGSSLTHPAGFF